MTRILSELLSAREPDFRLGLRKLEAAHGNPAHDIRLTSELLHASKAKLRELGLDPNDTTPAELYHALQGRIAVDDGKLEKTLRTRAATYVSAEGDVVQGMVHALQNLPVSRSCYALKSSVLKSLLKKQAPKRAMKQLGYRSLDSLLKHETAVHILTAAWLCESAAWRRNFVEQYRQLSPPDFETRQISISSPEGKRWNALAEKLVATKRHNLISFKELGAVVLLPLPSRKPVGSTTVVLGLALHALNEISAAASFLRLAQVRSDYGRMVQLVATDEASLAAGVLDRQVPWELVHRYYARLKHLFRDEVFEPYLELEDFSWHAVEKLMSHIEPSFSFWNGTSHVGSSQRNQPVSFNFLDAALGACNQLPFENRILHYGQSALRNEITLRYLKPEAIELAVKTTMQPQFAAEQLLV